MLRGVGSLQELLGRDTRTTRPFRKQTDAEAREKDARLRETSAPDQIARIKVEEGPHTRGAWSCPICGSPLPTRPADAEAHIGEDIGKLAYLLEKTLSSAPRNLANNLSHGWQMPAWYALPQRDHGSKRPSRLLPARREAPRMSLG